MAHALKTIRVTDETDFAGILDAAEAEEPVLLERHGVVFRVSREVDDIAAGYEPDAAAVRRTLAQTIGSWADLDVDQVKRNLYEARRAGSRPPVRP
jgi:hypothetical protein